MSAFVFRVFDDRYSVPILWLIKAPGEAQARSRAQLALTESNHCKAVEVGTLTDALFMVWRNHSGGGTKRVWFGHRWQAFGPPHGQWLSWCIALCFAGVVRPKAPDSEI